MVINDEKQSGSPQFLSILDARPALAQLIHELDYRGPNFVMPEWLQVLERLPVLRSLSIQKTSFHKYSGQLLAFQVALQLLSQLKSIRFCDCSFDSPGQLLFYLKFVDPLRIVSLENVDLALSIHHHSALPLSTTVWDKLEFLGKSSALGFAASLTQAQPVRRLAVMVANWPDYDVLAAAFHTSGAYLTHLSIQTGHRNGDLRASLSPSLLPRLSKSNVFPDMWSTLDGAALRVLEALHIGAGINVPDGVNMLLHFITTVRSRRLRKVTCTLRNDQLRVAPPPATWAAIVGALRTRL